MAHSFVKRSKLLQKHTKNALNLFGIFVLFGCATPEVIRIPNSVDVPHNIASHAQRQWETQPYQATAEYHFSLAQAYSNEGKVDRAIEEYRAALAYDNTSAMLHAKLAAEYLRKGMTSFAIEECEQSIAIDPKSIDVLMMLGGIYSINNDSDKALKAYDRVLKMDPTNDEAAVFKTQVLVEKNNNAAALKYIKGFVAKVKDSAAAWFYVGRLEFNHNHINEAIQAYRTALELRPGFSQATLSLGLIFETHNQTGKAVELYEEQLEQKQDLQVAGRLATLYLKTSRVGPALRVLKTMAVLDPEDLNTQMKIGLVFMQKEEWEEARKTFVEILNKVPDSDKVNYYLAATYEEMGKVELAIEHLLKVTADSKLFEDAYLHVAGVYRKQGNKDKSFSTIRDAIKKSPENAGFYTILASLYEDDKDYKNATAALFDGLKVFQDDERMRYFYGALLDKQGKTDEAVMEMEKILKQNPDHADALNFIAYTWTAQGIHLQDAEAMLKRALKLKPNSPFILDSMGWNQFMLGKNNEALVYLEKAAHLKSDETAILEHLVEVYSKNQMPERAAATKSRIQKLYQAEEAAGRMPASIDGK